MSSFPFQSRTGLTDCAADSLARTTIPAHRNPSTASVLLIERYPLSLWLDGCRAGLVTIRFVTRAPCLSRPRNGSEYSQTAAITNQVAGLGGECHPNAVGNRQPAPSVVSVRRETRRCRAPANHSGL